MRLNPLVYTLLPEDPDRDLCSWLVTAEKHRTAWTIPSKTAQPLSLSLVPEGHSLDVSVPGGPGVLRQGAHLGQHVSYQLEDSIDGLLISL